MWWFTEKSPDILWWALRRVQPVGREVVRMGRNRWHVTPDGGDWKVEREDADRSAGRFDTQGDAIDRAREIAQNQGGSVIVHRPDGRIREERTFPRSSDPFPPRG